MQSVPLSKIKLYPKWQDAPLGAVLAYASAVYVTVPNQDPTQLEGPKIALRAASNGGLQQFLVILDPEPYLAAEVSDQQQQMVFGAVEALAGPAVDVSEQYELRIVPAPVLTDIYEDPEPLTVFQTIAGDTPVTLAFVGKVGRSSRYMVLEGEAFGKLVERPTARVFMIGKLVLAPVKSQ